MKITELTFHDRTHNWTIDAAQFNDNLNLLVGVSGAGKTTLIRALSLIFKAARSQVALEDVTWKLQFLIQDQAFSWQLATGLAKGNLFAEASEKYEIISEQLIRLGDHEAEIFQRQANSIELNGKQAPKAKRTESVISLFPEDDVLAPIYETFGHLSFREELPHAILKTDIDLLEVEAPESLKFFQSSSVAFPVIIKLLIIEKHFPDLFAQIREAYCDIFPQVKDLRINVSLNRHHKYSAILEIQEINQNEWIQQPYISSGMFRTLMLVVNILAAPDGTVIAIDEFENSLGVNCLTEVTNLILDHCHRLQFIITSHHPYIINNIPWQNWSIVSREGNLIKVRHAPDIAELQTGSNLDKFSQLIDFLDSQEEN